MNKTLKAFSLISLLTFSLGHAQVNTPDPAAIVQQEYDPIVSMLDSLVTLNHVVRFNSLDGNCYDSKGGAACVIPSFSDATYSRRIAQINSPIPLSYNKYVKQFIQIYADKKRSLTERVMGLSNFYFPLYEEALDREGLPLEFKYLSVVESALNPVAVSRVGATGLWQFMYNTGLVYNLKINSYTDERKDPVKATQAACQYFKAMYAIYNDWLLVIASYNCGPGNVNRAIKRSGGKTNFWEIMPYLPKETRGYVPAFIAVTYVMNYAKEHNLTPVSPAYSFFQVDTIAVTQPVNFSALSRQLDLPMDVIAYLNPIYKRQVIPAREGATILRLPTNKIAQFISLEERIYAESAPSPFPVLPAKMLSNGDDDLFADASNNGDFIKKRVKRMHVVKRGETIYQIADQYDVTASSIKKMNHLRSSSVKKGQHLNVLAWVKVKVPAKQSAIAKNEASKSDKKDTAIATVEKADTANDMVATDSSQELIKKLNQSSEEKGNAKHAQKFVYHLVQPGDTLWNIAKRYDGVTVEQIKDINNLHDSHIKVGTKLKLMVG